MAVALFMAQVGCGRLGHPSTENWGSYPDGNVKAEWLPDGRSMGLLETFRYIDASGTTMENLLRTRRRAQWTASRASAVASRL